jgi:transmembrane sensor
LSGEAFFDVSHDPDRPFIVDAGGVKVTVIGTAFDIRLTQEQTTVELARGAVNVSLTAGNSETYVLAPGDVADVDRLTGTLTRSRMDISEIASWRDGRLFLNDVSISAAVAELQRYHPAWIKIPESALAEQRVTGLYDLHDPDRALRALVEPYGGKVRSISPFLRVLTLY